MLDEKATESMPEDHDAARRIRLFTVRIWAEPVGEDWERRGSARDVLSGACCSFREWSDLTSFLAAQVDDDGTSIQEA